MTPKFLGDPGIRVGVLAERVELLLAGITGAAGDRKWDDHPISYLQLPDPGPSLHHFSHELVAENVALLHGRHVAVVEMQIGPANRGGRDPDDYILGVEYAGFGHVHYFDPLHSHPAVGSH
jgi:hypothetical protein